MQYAQWQKSFLKNNQFYMKIYHGNSLYLFYFGATEQQQ